MGIVFENVWLMLTIAGVAMVIVSVIRQDKPEWGHWPLLVPLVIVGLAFGLDALVKTDTEAVNEIISTCKQAAVNGDAKTFMTFISPHYSDRSHRDKSELRATAQHVLGKASIKKIKTQSHVLTMDSGTAESQLSVVVHLNNDSQYAAAGSLVFVGMELSYEKIEKKWFINRAEIISVNNHPMNWSDVP